MDIDALMGSSEVAKRLGVDQAYVAALARKGLLPVARRLGRRGTLVFHASDVEAYAERQSVKLRARLAQLAG